MGLYRQLGRIASAPDQGGALLGLASGGGDGAAGQLKIMADQVPEPMSGWLKTVTRSGPSITVGGARSRLDDMWQAQVVERKSVVQGKSGSVRVKPGGSCVIQTKKKNKYK